MVDPSINEHHRRLDRLQLAALAALMFIGAAFVFSATIASQPAALPWFDQIWIRQIIWYALGIGAAAAICLTDYHMLARWSLVAYWISIFTLIAVLIPHIGQTHGWGARRWIDLPFFQFQPSEFAKLAFILAAANFLSRPPDELRLPEIFWKGIGLIMLPFVLILKEPDLGSALVLVPTGVVMMFVAGTPKRYLLKLGAGVGILGALCLADVLFAPRALQIPMQDSVGSGGLWGAGWCQGKQTSLQFMPQGAAHNDFIFSVIAEEEGFVGSLVVLTLYAVVLFTGLRIAGQARDRLGKLVAVGVVTLLFSHVFVNIGMNIRIVPVTGIPLPLLSYGGSSVLCSLIALGLMQNVYINRRGY